MSLKAHNAIMRNQKPFGSYNAIRNEIQIPTQKSSRRFLTKKIKILRFNKKCSNTA